MSPVSSASPPTPTPSIASPSPWHTHICINYISRGNKDSYTRKPAAVHYQHSLVVRDPRDWVILILLCMFLWLELYNNMVLCPLYVHVCCVCCPLSEGLSWSCSPSAVSMHHTIPNQPPHVCVTILLIGHVSLMYRDQCNSGVYMFE